MLLILSFYIIVNGTYYIGLKIQLICMIHCESVTLLISTEAEFYMLITSANKLKLALS
jgi:hypothetical protein